jgi:hypothetical protein
MTAPSYIAPSLSAPEPTFKNGQPRDILWDRPIFRAPPLANPRAIFDPIPFRFLLPSSMPNGGTAARRLLRAA